MKILSAKNGIALIAVLAILLFLTLLLPVMFTMSDTATKEASKGTNREKAYYLARTGVEMTVSSLKGTLKSDESGYKEMYMAMQDKTANETYGVSIDATSGRAYVNVETIYLYLKDNPADVNKPISKYACGDAAKAVYDADSTCTFVGSVDVKVTYDGDPAYYKVDETSGTKEKVTKTDAVDAATGEIKEDYMFVDNDNYIVSGTATVGVAKSTRSAVVIETKDVASEDEQIVQYAGTNYETAPGFIRVLNGDPAEPDTLTNRLKIYDYGGNECFADPSKANTKKTVKYMEANFGGSYNNKYVYVYSTIGNMLIKCEGSDLLGNEFCLGTLPGIRWTDSFYEVVAKKAGSFRSLNYNSYSDSIQKYNFNSYCASNTLQVDMPVELRVNPARVTMSHNVLRTGDGFAANAPLFKAIGFQAKDIVFNKRADMMISLYNAKKIDGCENAGRGGFMILSAPTNTPYSYYNDDRGETVPAGKVYFNDDVYLWVIKYGHQGIAADVSGSIQQTVYAKTIIDRTTNFTQNGDKWEYTDGSHNDFQVYRLFKAGDVYYFNAGVVGNDGTNLGVNLVNWFMETKYFTDTADDAWSFFKNMRQELYKWYVNATGLNSGIYKNDDMYLIGNMADDPTLIAPDVEDEVYVVWDS